MPEPSSSAASSPASVADRGDAPEVAEQVLTTWARPDRTHAEWWAELEPLLTPSAAEAYESTDPAVIPPLKLEGEPVEDVGAPDPYVTTYYLETSEGRFGVDLARSPGGGPWRAFSIIFPDGQSRRQ